MYVEDVDPSEDGTFVVAGSASDELTGGLVDGESDRIDIPAIAFRSLDIVMRRSRLTRTETHGPDIVVTVDEHRLSWISANLAEDR
jgi:hypothetical protein